MSPVVFLLLCVAVLLGTAVLAIGVARSTVATTWVYCLTLAACLAAAVTALAVLTVGGEPFTVTLPLGLPWVGANFRLDALSAFFLLVINMTYSLFDTFGVIDVIVKDKPANNPITLVYKVYLDGFRGNDLGSSSAQSVILMAIVIALTAVQFRYVEKKVHYG